MHSRNHSPKRLSSHKNSQKSKFNGSRSSAVQSTKRPLARPTSAFRRRGSSASSAPFYAPEVWHEPQDSNVITYMVQEPGAGYYHPVTVDEIEQRIEQLPSRFVADLEVVQLSQMTRKRSLFPCYGMQWGVTVFLYPIEESLTEIYVRPPSPAQLIEARMYGGKWQQMGRQWKLTWTPATIKDFYLNNVLIHEIGHLNDQRNTNADARERYANWFAIEYGFRASRGRK